MPRIRPLRTNEEIKAVPLDKAVEIELEEEGTITLENDTQRTPPEELTTDTDAERDAKRQAARDYRKQKKEQDEALHAETSDLKQQLEDMRRATEEQRKQIAEGQRQQAEAHRIAQEREHQVSQYALRAEDAEYDAVLTAISAAESEAEGGQRELENALNNADNKAVVTAQRRIARAEAKLVQLEEGKQVLEDRKNQMIAKLKAEAERPRQQQTFTPEQQIDQAQGLSHSQKAWLRDHMDAWTDQRKNLRLQGAHVEAEDLGYAPGTQKYFTYLEERLGYKKAPVVEDEDGMDEDDAPAPRRKLVSAPVSRDSGSPGKRNTGGKITLSPKQREAAAIAGIDEITYARQMLKLETLKDEGYYNE